MASTSLSRTPRECVDWNKFNILSSYIACVALLVSAWIEIAKNRQINQLQPIVALLVSAWIEILDLNESRKLTILSHSSWVRGLKLHQSQRVVILISRTPRECVDWNHFHTCTLFPLIYVALLVSAWIEICNDDKVVLVSVGRTPRECVDWN